MAALKPLLTLRAARKARNLNQTEVGALIGKEQGHFAKIERGEIGFSAREALTLCQTFKLSIEQLLDEESTYRTRRSPL